MPTYPGLNGGYQFPARPGDGQRGDTPCTCPTEELTVTIPTYIADQMRHEATKSGNTVDQLVAGAFRNVQTGEHAPVDPCIAIK
ncbi:hypothetical protein GCM10022419_008100 [Nonomuraea rosea]|uniref:CopG family transcriptional regulator n=1 Tax=Nonomuraea rosea TaxID=638574 RepID=A0ABP6VD48_9ACTN